ncbi:hypothetical protein N566_24515 [Streptomycetaceae bacterium MP113-05]|nr:hypothetical protein N566_24515 [Streptomycetaceae bacterium MP113-05]
MATFSLLEDQFKRRVKIFAFVAVLSLAATVAGALATVLT